ncbi:MAG: hypothetical protein A2622_13365 [Bdellovibrionales bacterium RIFCSPHIGHO2_01_FULL_40_29]|nr:MAG: hypothetical protein A2622_13365 [Bdellovibrionales bacterium RIFCSPHIGHO2_01_FULL_40_29]OFZ34314.1 MAG: hypothetical protein A3D17_04585 [Bdellovibrionales bacterium RIFCSPHIGHO2_02_FULL_40_15]
MQTNDVLRSIRYMLNINDQKIVDILLLAELRVELSEVKNFLKNEDEPGYIICSDIIMSHFLDGLIFYKRGRDKDRPAQPIELPVTNNTVLKKMKVAFELKEDDLHVLLESGGYKMGRSELSAFLRKKGHPNYRECGDQVLRYFLKGLTLRLRA